MDPERGQEEKKENPSLKRENHTALRPPPPPPFVSYGRGSGLFANFGEAFDEAEEGLRAREIIDAMCKQLTVPDHVAVADAARKAGLEF